LKHNVAYLQKEIFSLLSGRQKVSAVNKWSIDSHCAGLTRRRRTKSQKLI